MATFTVGSKVRRINSYNDGLNIGDTGVIIEIIDNGKGAKVKNDKDKTIVGGHDLKNLELVTNNQNNMSDLKSKFVALFLTEPEKSFRKAGVTNGDGILTEEGREVFLTWLLKKHGDEFKKEVVDELLKDEDEK